MKKILISSLLLFFIVFPQRVVFAQESSYALPYPGILPDNPLYILKTIRDNTIAFFISDPLKKSRFYLLQSDKRLAASLDLVREGQQKDALAISTLSKSTNYFDQAIGQVNVAKQSGENVSDIEGQLRDSIIKHRQIVASMEQLVSPVDKVGIVQEEKRLTDSAEVVSTLIPKQ